MLSCCSAADAPARAGVVARRDLELAEAEAARAQAEAARAQARTSLYGSALAVNQQLGLRSDIAGTVVERNINPGQELRPEHNGAALFIVSDPTRLWVQIDAQEADLRDLLTYASGQPLVLDPLEEADRIAAMTPRSAAQPGDNK